MSAARTERLLNLLTLLLNARRPVSLREIRELEEFGAYRTADPKSGERAFERDKAALVELGVPLRWVPPEHMDDEEGLGGYVVDRDRYFLPEIELDPSDLALLSIAGAAAATVDGFPGRAAVIRALAKLGFDGDAIGASPTLAHAPIQGVDPERVLATLELLHDAVARRRRVVLAYQRGAEDPTVREVDPYGLYYRQGSWYLVGHCHLRRAERTFHLGRISDAKRASSRRAGADFEVPATFSLKEHVTRRPWEFPQDPPIEVVVRLAERLVPAIPELFGARARTQRLPEGALVRLRVTHRRALIAAVLPFGVAAEVLAPADLRAAIAAIYEALTQRYDASEAWP